MLFPDWMNDEPVAVGMFESWMYNLSDDSVSVG